MYDTIHFHFPAYAIAGGFTDKVVDRVAAALTGKATLPSQYTQGTYLRGNLKNLKVTMTLEYLTIKGSLSKYILGSQLDSLTLVDIEAGIKGLSQLLGLPLEHARVTRLDIAHNIETQYKPKAYWPYFGKAPRFRRLEQDNGLYYRKAKKQLLLYDKLRELKRTKQDIPLAYKGKNLLRFEVQYKREVSKQLNRAPVTGATLYDPAFYRQVQEEWAKEYHAIYKNREFALMLHNVRTVRDFLNYLLLHGIKARGGVNHLLKVIAQGKLLDKLTPQNANYIQKKLFAVAETPLLTFPSPLIEELDRKVEALTQQATSCRNAA